MHLWIISIALISLVFADVDSSQPNPNDIGPKADYEVPEIKPKEDRLKGSNYQKDANSFSYKKIIDPDKTTEEEDKKMMEFIDAWAGLVPQITSPIFNYEVSAGGILYFYEDIVTVPQTIRGAYSVPDASTKSLTITITDPNNVVVFLKTDVRDLIFYPTVKVPGKYTIEISNSNVILSIILSILQARK